MDMDAHSMHKHIWHAHRCQNIEQFVGECKRQREDRGMCHSIDTRCHNDRTEIKRREQQRDLKRKPLVGRRGYGGRPADRGQPEAKSPRHPHTVKLGTRDKGWVRGERQRREGEKASSKGEKGKKKGREDVQKRDIKVPDKRDEIRRL